MRTRGILLNNFRPILGNPVSGAKISSFPKISGYRSA
jgi:hypothetical protein